ncbi:MAG: GNAT family N-acetyltransferase [Syntrophaceae bacterium]|nr:GNAT family N-acetyltransferase [Syntrophaceae bacterium]
MMDLIVKNEIAYLKNYCECTETDEFIKFVDRKIPDMYSHNLTLIKKPLAKERLIKIIMAQAELKKRDKSDFLNIEANFPMDDKDVSGVFLEGGGPDICYYMAISPERYTSLKGNSNCVLKEANNEEILADGKLIDVKVNTEEDGEDFAIRRCDRKQAVYREPNDVKFYVCYDKGTAVGMCEMYMNGEAAKIEEFDVPEEHQRKGYGTAIIRELLKIAHQGGAKTAYVVTYSEESAKDMYAKCGFEIVGEKRNFYYTL